MALERLPLKVGSLALLAFPLLMPVSHLSAQESGWAPFLGCWEPESDETEGVLCFVPNGDQVDMLTIADGQVAFTEYFAADGSSLNIDQDGCTGTEMARFSDDRERIYTYSDLTCEEGPRKSSGIISMISPTAWLDVRSIEGEDGPVAWVQGYVRGDSDVLTDLGFENPNATALTTLRGIRRTSVARIDVEDVIDASDAVDQHAVQAWLVESGQGISRLDADGLIAMDDAGVDPDVIDVVVAASFPNHFALNRDERRAANAYGRRAGVRPIFLGAGYGRYYDPFYSGFGYSSFYGYGGYGHPYYGGGYYYRPVPIYSGRSNGDAGGRAVKGQGYRRGGSSAGSTGGSRRQPAVSPSGGSTRSQPSRSRGKAKRRGGR